ncbi:uncharacterized protein LOC144712108 [Wolffia australiana]
MSSLLSLDCVAPAVSSPPPSSSRCHGLDLLAMAALCVVRDSESEEHVDPSEIDSPSSKDSDRHTSEDAELAAAADPPSANTAVKRRSATRRRTALPHKFQDSVLQPWKRRSRPRRP